MAITLDGNNGAVFQADGNVGIGTSSPTTPLHIEGEGIYVNRTAGDPYLIMDTSGGSTTAIYGGSNGVRAFTGGAERMRIDSAGRVTMPYQPAFTIGMGAPWRTVPANSVIPFDVKLYDIGNNFNTATGEFTAPVSGTYMFHTNLYVDTNAQSFYFTKNGAFVQIAGDAIVTYRNAETGDGTINPSMQIYLNAGDYVSYKSRNTQTSYVYGPHSHFSGFLIG